MTFGADPCPGTMASLAGEARPPRPAPRSGGGRGDSIPARALTSGVRADAHPLALREEEGPGGGALEGSLPVRRHAHGVREVVGREHVRLPPAGLAIV